LDYNKSLLQVSDRTRARQVYHVSGLHPDREKEREGSRDSGFTGGESVLKTTESAGKRMGYIIENRWGFLNS
jgi:hypothetical protein